jgi:integrase
MKHTKVWYYEFIFAGRLVKESAKTTSKTVAKLSEQARRRELEKGFNGRSDERRERIQNVRELATGFLSDYKVRQPKSVTFAQHALGHVGRLLGDLMAVDVTDRAVVKYQTDRLKEDAAPKTINDEVGFLLRVLPITQAGAIRAQLRVQKLLKLKSKKHLGKAYSAEEKADLIHAAHEAPRSKAIHLATMFALHAGMRDKEIRTLPWSSLDLGSRIVTVGESKTDAGTGRTIPLNEDLYGAVVEYAKWYTARFGIAQPAWYVFPFGKPLPNDPRRPQTSLKTAWRNARTRASVEARFHDARHTIVTDLAESGVGDEVIRDMAGHVSKDMLKHYSHIRTQAKRRAVDALLSKQRLSENPPEPVNSEFQFSHGPTRSPTSRASELAFQGNCGLQVLEGFGSSGRTRTYNPSVNSRMLYH